MVLQGRAAWNCECSRVGLAQIPLRTRRHRSGGGPPGRADMVAARTTGMRKDCGCGFMRSDTVRARPRMIASKKVASHCAQAFTGVHASEETSRFPLSPKLGNGRARTWHTGLHRDPQCPKAIPRERGGARLLSISAGANAGRAGWPSPEERRIRGDLPTAISCNG